jgi:hypothetical protein
MSDASMTYSNEHDDDGINDAEDHTFRNWVFALFGTILAVCLAFFAWNAYQQSLLPAPFTAKPGDSLMTYVTSSKDSVERARIAVRAAERTRQPVFATELCGQSVQRVPGQCGRPQEVSYKLARTLASFPGTVMLNVPLYPGDFMDARKGIFIEAARPVTTLSGVTVVAPAN